MTEPSSKKPKKAKRDKNLETPEVTSKYYLSNSKLLPEVIRAKQLNQMTPELATMLYTLCKKYAQTPSFSRYSYKEDMIAEGLANLCQNALKFNSDKFDNPFSYYTSCIHNSFLHYLNTEKRHRQIKDQLLVDMGENPSYSFHDEVKNNNDSEFSNELVDLKQQMIEAKQRLIQEAADKVIKDAKIAAEKELKEKTAEKEIEDVMNETKSIGFNGEEQK